MGCNSSKPNNVVAQTRPASMSSKKVEKKERSVSEEELAAMREKELEKQLSALLDRERKNLSDLARPAIERRMSCDNMNDAGYEEQSPDSDSESQLSSLVTDEELLEEEKSTKFHEKRDRTKKAKLKAEQEQKWMLFHNLDMYDESDMVSLVRFMDTVMKRVPNMGQQDDDAKRRSYMELNSFQADDGIIALSRDNSRSNSLSKIIHHVNLSTPTKVSNGVDGEGEGSINIDRRDSKGNILIQLSRENSVENFLRLENITFSSVGKPNSQTHNRSPSGSFHAGDSSPDVSSNASNSSHILRSLHAMDEPKEGFVLPSGLITPAIAIQILHVYKNGGHLSVKSIHKILRLAYRHLKRSKNTTKISLADHEKITVVGDLHGQLADLFHIFDDAGLPSNTHKFVFNGDFVDRGDYGVEVVAILLAWHVAMPNHVFLNRGNHEDFAICCAYGFQRECIQKYDELTFGMFIEVFNHLPLFAVINEEIFIVHGGLFHARDTSLEDLQSIRRFEFSLRDLPEEGENLEPISRTHHSDFLKQIQRDALWSDPRDFPGLDYNPRGAGVSFGPDVTQEFLKRNGLRFIVRSHECVRSGFERPYQSEVGEGLLCTIFSASNYSGGGNTAAYLDFFTATSVFAKGIAASLLYSIPQSMIQYSVQYFHVHPEDYGLHGEEEPEDDDATAIAAAAAAAGLNSEKTMFGGGSDKFMDDENLDDSISSFPIFSLQDLIIRKKQVLLDSFFSADPHHSGLISLTTWADVMSHTLKLHLRWAAMLPVLVKEDCFRVDSSDEKMIDYVAFLNSFMVLFTVNQSGKHKKTTKRKSKTKKLRRSKPAPVQHESNDNSLHLELSSETSSLNSDSDLSDDSDEEDSGDLHDQLENVTVSDDELNVSGSIIEALYLHHKQLEVVFQYFDSDGDGVITKQEFLQGCEILNETLPNDEKLLDCERVLNLMDVKENGEIDINLFFEMFRMTDAHSNISKNMSNVIKMDKSPLPLGLAISPPISPKGGSMSIGFNGPSSLSSSSAVSSNAGMLGHANSSDAMDINGVKIAVDGFPNQQHTEASTVVSIDI